MTLLSVSSAAESLNWRATAYVSALANRANAVDSPLDAHLTHGNALDTAHS